jgi:hypothetical protein
MPFEHHVVRRSSLDRIGAGAEFEIAEEDNAVLGSALIARPATGAILASTITHGASNILVHVLDRIVQRWI